MSERLTNDEAAKIAERVKKATKVVSGQWTVVQDPARSPERRLIVLTPDKDLVINVDAYWVPYDPKRKGNLNLDAFGQINDVAQFIAASITDVPHLLDDLSDLRTQLAEAAHRADAAEGLLREIEAYCEPIAPGLDPVGKALYERIGPLLAVEE